MKTTFNENGFTLTEVMFVALLAVFVIGTALSAWLFTHKLWTGESYHTALRVDMLKAVETIKDDVRLSSGTYISFYPSTGGDYTALSMPLADVDANGFYPVTSNGKIAWNKTVVYHIVTDTSGKHLRRTVIDSWDSAMDKDERYAQLEEVVAGTITGDSQTDIVKKYLDVFTIEPSSPVIDFYDESAAPVKSGNVVFGYVQLDSGDHTIRFTVTGKNSQSSGYAFAIDNIRINPSNSCREAEYYASSFAPAGAIASSGKTITRYTASMWGNNNYLEYGASEEGDYLEFSDGYDLWRESSFTSASRNNVKLDGDEVRAALDIPAAFDSPDTALDPELVTWYAYEETRDSSQAGRDGYVNPPDVLVPPAYPVVVRTVVRNAYLGLDPDKNEKKDLIRVKFRSSSGGALKIYGAYITRKDPSSAADYDGLPNTAPSGKDPKDYHMHQKLFFKDTDQDFDGDGSAGDIVPGITILSAAPQNGEAWSEWTAFPLVSRDADGNDADYLVTFCVADVSNAASKYWSGSSPNTYYIQGDYSAGDLVRMAGDPDWSKWQTESFPLEGGGSAALTVNQSNDICAVSEIDTWEDAGTVESQIFDTTLSDPAYGAIKFSEYSPSGTAASVKGRSSDDENMTGAADWSAVTGSTPNAGGRYAQFYAELSAEPYWAYSSYSIDYDAYITEQIGAPNPVYEFPSRDGEYLVTGVDSNWIDDVENSWPGADSICAITGDIAKKNDYGQVKITVDGNDLVKVLMIEVGTKLEFQGRELAERNVLEVEPRNTGK